MAKHEQLRKKWKIDSSGRRWSQEKPIRGSGQTERLTDCIDLCWQYVSQQGAFNSTDEVLLDVSQDLERRPWATNRFPTMTRSTEFFSFTRQRVLAGAEYLQVLGFDVSASGLKLDKLSQHQLKDLAGDCMAPPSIALTSLACIAAMRQADPV